MIKHVETADKFKGTFKDFEVTRNTKLIFDRLLERQILVIQSFCCGSSHPAITVGR
jgi:hypothetical protein